MDWSYKMAAIQKRKLKVRTNISIDEALKIKCTKYAAQRYNTSLSAVISALLKDWETTEDKKKAENTNQGKLVL